MKSGLGYFILFKRGHLRNLAKILRNCQKRNTKILRIKMRQKKLQVISFNITSSDV